MTESSYIRFAVALGTYEHGVIAGEYFPSRRPGPGILQVLLHGSTYDHRYWAPGVIGGEDYSYARFMAERGCPVLALDLPGTGDSSRPDGDQVDFDIVGAAVADVIARLRTGESGLPGHGGRIALVGHSVGAMLAIYTQARWHPADVLVSTGMGALPVEPLGHYRPGEMETALQQTYLRMDPETRRSTFYYLPSADPAVIDFDNLHLRTALPRGIYRSAMACRRSLDVSRAREVGSPVYIQLGENDPVAPAANAGAERSCWPGAAAVEVATLPAMGHCFNLHRNRESSWRGIDTYLRAW